MINGLKFSLAMAAGLMLAVPGAAATSDEEQKKGSFISQLAKAAEELSGETKDTTGSKKQDKKGKKTASKSKDDKTSLSELIKSSDSKTKTADGKKVLSLSVMGNIEERAQEMVLFGEQPESLKRYIDTMRRVRLDDEMQGIVIRMGPNNMGMATAQELREAITELQARNKKVTAILEDDSQSSYLVAAAADEVVMPPSADIMLHGVSANSYFLKNLLQKVGVKVEIIHIGQYKSYGETFTHDDFTTPARQNMDEIVNGVYDQVKGMVAESRKLTPEQAEQVMNAGPVNAAKAKEMGLVDRVAYADEVLESLENDNLEIVDSSDYKTSTKSSSSSSDISLLSLLSMMSSSEESGESGSSDHPRVAVLYAVGAITLGSNGGSGLGADTEIASEDFIEELEKLKEDDKIKAVILRVNSPGGSAFASDLIWKKIEELKKKKPVVASMGDVAASGGYYISMGATRIVAQPGTVTGSIGVVGGKPNLKGLYEKVGVTKTTISKGRYAGLFSETSDFSPEEHQAIEGMMKRTYDEFVTKAATGRNRSYDQLHEVAQGRVWTGAKAKEVGLVDELGGLDKAIVETKGLIGLKADDKVRLIAYPKEKSLVDILQKAFGTSTSTVKVDNTMGLDVLLGSLPLPEGLASVMKQAVTITNMFQQEKVLAIMPFTLELR
jgi:protease-4